MRKLSSITGLFLLWIVFPSCIFLMEENYSEEVTPVDNYAADPQYRGQDSVSYFLSSRLDSTQTYKPYSFGRIAVITPTPVKELSDLKLKRNLLLKSDSLSVSEKDSLLQRTDNEIAVLEEYLEKNKVADNYRLSHVFSVSDASGHTVYESFFTLSSSFHVRDVQVKMRMVMDKDRYDWFHFFATRQSVFSREDNDRERRENNNFYDFFYYRIENLEEGKEELLLSAILTTKVCRKLNKIDEQAIAEENVRVRLSEQLGDGYRPVDFSPLQALSTGEGESEKHIGYSVFHRYKMSSDSVYCIYTEMDPWFVPGGFVDIAPPFDEVFDSK